MNDRPEPYYDRQRDSAGRHPEADGQPGRGRAGTGGEARFDYGRARFIIPAVLISSLALAGLLSLAIFWSSYGWVMVLIVPLVGGVVLGYLTEVNHVLLWLIGIMVVFGVIGGLFTASLAGLLCGGIAAMIIIVPMAVGASLGLLLRVVHERREMKDRRRAVVGLLLATTGLLWAEAQMPLPAAVEEVRTQRVLDAAPLEAWDTMVFYEEVGAEPPRLVRIGLPYPVGSEGIVDEVGDTKRCLYVKGGYLIKLATDFRPGERFAFDIIEQVGIEDRSVELIDGSFAFEEVAPGQTLVTLTTRYRPLLQARAAWRPFEIAVVHALHDHVLDWMESSGAKQSNRSQD